MKAKKERIKEKKGEELTAEWEKMKNFKLFPSKLQHLWDFLFLPSLLYSLHKPLKNQNSSPKALPQGRPTKGKNTCDFCFETYPKTSHKANPSLSKHALRETSPKKYANELYATPKIPWSHQIILGLFWSNSEFLTVRNLAKPNTAFVRQTSLKFIRSVFNDS